MFRYILAILLINTCYRSLGNPVSSRNISTYLTGLEVHCENPFLNNLIKSKIQECSVTVPPFSEKQFQCLIFYDMSNQLCAAVSTSQLTLNEDYSAKINEEQDVNSLCVTAKDWEFGNLNEFAPYKVSLEKVFKHPVTCGKVCGAEELTSNDANFFCKFFNWGLGTLKPPVAESSQKSTNVSATASVSAPVVTEVKNDAPDQSIEPMDISIKDTTSDKTKVTAQSLPSVPEKVSDPGDIDIKPDTITTSTNKVSSPVVANVEKGNEAKLDKPLLESENVSGNDQIEMAVENVAQDDKVGKAEVTGDLEHKEPVENKNSQGDGFDYQDVDGESDEGKEGPLDVQGGDDNGDPMTDDTKHEKEQSRADEHKEPSLSSFNHEIAQGDYYHTVQDGYSDGDDDHFFTFFLTAVVMVILIYVLYHNKNKVSKVFFGLLLEGRQSGRRRNSRGHAYRRLDTLEQAMSTNTAAPPSKIIY
ncbi:trans-Golgi network integral membrane protein 2 [Manduca sexta]|uniref:trans-Golgi network integral membrane protein 2 n=1 Tax=Manduca sexta TaxID=7130 RepID=UPI00188FB348|nr:trans-Golgi network integral membrane protein 2 [Manduca sexta]